MTAAAITAHATMAVAMTAAAIIAITAMATAVAVVITAMATAMATAVAIAITAMAAATAAVAAVVGLLLIEELLDFVVCSVAVGLHRALKANGETSQWMV